MAWTAADLTNVENAIRDKITGGAVQSYSTNVGGRSVTHMTLESLLRLKAEIAAEVAIASQNSDAVLIDTARR